MWIITNGKTYTMRNADGHVTTTSDKSKATRFEDRRRADSFCDTLPKVLKNLSFHPIYVPDQQVQPAPVQAVSVEHSVAPQINASLLDLDGFVSHVRDFQKFVLSASEQRPLLVDAKRKVEDEILDIEHAIEFSKCNVVGGWKLYNRLREARMRRRQYKDAIMRIDILMEAQPMDVARANTVNQIMGMEKRQYAPRALPELFVGMGVTAD